MENVHKKREEANSMGIAEEYKNDPRNPYLQNAPPKKEQQ
jgi:ATP synthase j chain